MSLIKPGDIVVSLQIDYIDDFPDKYSGLGIVKFIKNNLVHFADNTSIDVDDAIVLDKEKLKNTLVNIMIYDYPDFLYYDVYLDVYTIMVTDCLIRNTDVFLVKKD